MIQVGDIIDRGKYSPETDEQSVIWNRSELKNIGKLQVIGHTPSKNNKPIYNKKSNSWNIDTGSGYEGNLT